MAEMFCHKCGTQSSEDGGFCPKCGEALMVDEASPQMTPTPMDLPPPPVVPPPAYTQKNSQMIIYGVVGVIAVLIVVVIIIAVTRGNSDNYDSGNNDYTQPSLSSQPSQSAPSSGGVDLSETYTNTAEGLSFKYPSGWYSYTAPLEEGDLVWLEKADGTNMYVSVSYPDEHMFSYTEADFEELLESEGFIVGSVVLSDARVSGVRARKVVIRAAVEGVSIVRVVYFYNMEYDYTVAFTSSQSGFSKNEPVFDAIIDSYRIN
jgi:hypothetical protein